MGWRPILKNTITCEIVRFMEEAVERRLNRENPFGTIDNQRQDMD
jgi:hypothetical protein